MKTIIKILILVMRKKYLKLFIHIGKFFNEDFINNDKNIELNKIVVIFCIKPLEWNGQFKESNND